MTNLTDTIGDGNESCFLAARSRHKCRFPAQLKIEARVGAADEEHEAKVACANVEGANEHAAACCAHEYRNDDVVVGLLETAGRVCETACDGVGDGVGRSLDEVGGECVEFERFHDLQRGIVSCEKYKGCRRI